MVDWAQSTDEKEATKLELCENQCFCLPFAFMLKMHVGCDNQYITGANRGTILGQLLLFVCMDICVLSLPHECEIRGYFVYLIIVKYLSILFKFSHSMLDID